MRVTFSSVKHPSCSHSSVTSEERTARTGTHDRGKSLSDSAKPNVDDNDCDDPWYAFS